MNRTGSAAVAGAVLKVSVSESPGTLNWKTVLSSRLFKSALKRLKLDPGIVLCAALMEFHSSPIARYSKVRLLFSEAIQLITIEDARSEEHTSELQSRGHIVCRL